MLIFYSEKLLAPRPTPKQERPSLVSCPQLVIECTRTYPQDLQAASSSSSSVRTMRTRHAEVTEWGHVTNPPVHHNDPSVFLKCRIS